MKLLLQEIKRCTTCLTDLEHGVNPVVSATSKSKIAIIGQAPGRIVHETGIPWDDKSGERLREWLGVDDQYFYDANIFAIIPMGFCYPGKGKSGDLPPRKECAPLWHSKVLDLTETVKNYQEYLPNYLPLPHPSPRNNIWLKKNEWFNKEVIPYLRTRIQSTLELKRVSKS